MGQKSFLRCFGRISLSTRLFSLSVICDCEEAYEVCSDIYSMYYAPLAAAPSRNLTPPWDCQFPLLDLWSTRESAPHVPCVCACVCPWTVNPGVIGGRLISPTPPNKNTQIPFSRFPSIPRLNPRLPSIDKTQQSYHSFYDWHLYVIIIQHLRSIIHKIIRCLLDSLPDGYRSRRFVLEEISFTNR